MSELRSAALASAASVRLASDIGSGMSSRASAGLEARIDGPATAHTPTNPIPASISRRERAAESSFPPKAPLNMVLTFPNMADFLLLNAPSRN
jgi:hypothetical protein